MTEQDSEENQGGFFSMDLKQIDRMVAAGAGAEDLMAYMVLARGINLVGDQRISTHGANSIATRTGMSNRRATDCLKWLHESGYILKPEECSGVPEYLGRGKGRGQKTRWVIVEALDRDDVYLANELVEGVGRGKLNPPLMRIYGGMIHSGGRLLSDMRLDAMMVLLHLYRHQDLEQFGGVDPRSGIYREWSQAENSQGECVTKVEGTNSSLFEIEAESRQVFIKFRKEAMFYVEDDEEGGERFFDALNSLHRMGFIYEVTQVWSSNPNDKLKGRKAELLYTLYIHDRHARQSEPYLQKDIHRLAFRTGAMDSYTEFAGLGHEQMGRDSDNQYDEANILTTSESGTGRFRYLATTKNGGYPLGVYRLRFRPKTRDTGIGMEAERRRVGSWVNSIQGIGMINRNEWF